jgi:hypothetical protein
MKIYLSDKFGPRTSRTHVKRVIVAPGCWILCVRFLDKKVAINSIVETP